MKIADKKKKTIVVLGAPRSGTSLTSGILNILGVDLGSVRPPDETNPRGYFEDIEISKLIKEIYNLTGSSWRVPPSKEKVNSVRNKVNDKVKEFCTERSKSREIWGWKVPGTVFIIDLFLPHIQHPHFIAVFRDPLKTAQSLRKRTKFIGEKEVDLLEALRLTNLHNQEIIDFLIGNKHFSHTVISYEDVVQEPLPTATKLSNFLGLELTKEKKEKINKLIISIDKMAVEKKKAAFRYRWYYYPLLRVKRFTRKSLENPEKTPSYITAAIKNNFLKRI